MRKVKLVLALAVLAIVAGTLGVGQTHQIDPTDCAGETYAIPGEDGTVLYIDDSAEDGLPIGPPGLNAYWVYLETNNHKGLQRGGYHPISAVIGEDLTEQAGERDKCNTTSGGGHAASLKADTIVF